VAQATHAAEADGATLAVAEAQLWWPRGLGGQPLYTLVAAWSARPAAGRRHRRIGLRTLRPA
jgi:beta-mannosidase